MFWIVLIFLLLGAIGGLLWMRNHQNRQWQNDMANLEADIAAGKWSHVHEDNQQEGWQGQGLSANAKAAYSKTLARLRLLAAQHQHRQQELESKQTHDTVMPDKQKRLSSIPDPVIVPFVETETPEYSPRKISRADFEEITLEDATRALTEAAFQEAADSTWAVAAETPTAPPAVETPVSAHRPAEDLEVIDLNDPVFRRTREKVLANVGNIQIRQAQKPHIELTQNALRTLERGKVIEVADIPSRWDEINVQNIRSDLERQTAARSRLAAAVAPVRDYQLPVIESDEILANLSRAASMTPSQSTRRSETESRRRTVAESLDYTQAVVVKPKKQTVPKVSRFQQPEKFAARTVQPTVAIVEPPVVPRVEPIAADIPSPPAFKTSTDWPTDHEMSIHVSSTPARALRDFLISEAEEVVTTPQAFQTASRTDTVTNQDAVNPETVFEHKAVENHMRPSETETARVAAEEVVLPSHHSPENAVSPTFAELRPLETASPSAQTEWQAAEAIHQEHRPSENHLPGVDLLLPPQFDPSATPSEEALLENSITIEDKLAEFKVKVRVVDSYSGPVITRYEIEPDVGVRGNAVLNLEKDLARSLGVASIRVVETIPGKTCMGLELPNPRRQMIRLSEIFNSEVFKNSPSKLTLALGQDITGQPVVTDLAKAPHLLVAGTTGSGKSVGVNAMILSMLFKATPEDVRMIMIDPKMLELSIYEGIPHLLAPVVTDMKLAANALNWCVNEMEKRYRLMSHLGVRNLAGFNEKITEAAAQGQKISNPFSLSNEHPEPLEKLPSIVVVVDEFADLMMTEGKKIEGLISRLTQKARAAGIHLILATQRPSVDVITGLIKANIPTRIAFQVSSKIDSRTILDQMGAENLLGQGDMLFLPPGTSYPQRVHGAFASDDEVHNVVEYLKQFGEPHYVDDILSHAGSDDVSTVGNRNDSDDDPMYDEAVALVVKTRKASISSVQRALRIGYNRAARLVEQMENDGIVSPAESNGNRTVLAPDHNHLD